jgi:hypothetical protein
VLSGLDSVSKIGNLGLSKVSMIPLQSLHGPLEMCERCVRRSSVDVSGHRIRIMADELGYRRMFT